MTKKSFAKTIFEVVDNGKFLGNPKKEIIDDIETLLYLLKPKNIVHFSKIGQPEEKSTIEECWN